MSWPRKALAEIAMVNPRIPAHVSSRRSSTIDFVPMASLSETGCVTPSETRSLADVLKGYTYFENGDVLVAKITPCMENGKAALVDNLPHGIGFGSTEFHVLRPTGEVSGEYLFWMIWSPMFRATAGSSMTGSAGQKRVPAGFFERFQVPLPPLPEQKRIATILDAADALRAKRRESIEQLDSLVQATFLDMFGDPVTNPKGWNRKPIAYLGEVQGGLQVTSKRQSLPLEQPYLRVANVFRGALDLAEIKRIRLTPEEASRTALERDDLLIVEGHGNKEEVGRCARWDGSISPCVHQNHLIRLRCHRSAFHPVYAETYLNSTGGRCALVQSSRTTSGLNTISVSKVRDTDVLTPPLALQSRFASIVECIEQQKTRLKAHLAELDALFASLQSRAFNGELVA